MNWLTGTVQDTRYAVRSLLRSPRFAMTAVATLAIGIGVDTAVFTVTDSVLFKSFPVVKNSDRILYVSTPSSCCRGVSYPDFEDWRKQATAFRGMALFGTKSATVSRRNGGFLETGIVNRVTPNAFALLGVEPIIGRDFTPADTVAGAPPVAVLRYRFWARRFGKDPSVIGRMIKLDGVATTVIGVMPRGFNFPNGRDLWIPLVPSPAVDKRDFRRFEAFGRLADGATVQQARAEMQTIGHRLARAHPDTNRHAGQDMLPVVQDFNEFFVGASTRTAYEAMWAAVAFVLLIACANVANLLLGRAISRAREISVRASLGAGRWRVARQLLIESLILSAAGGIFGWCISAAAVRAYAATPGSGSRFAEMLGYAMDYRVLAHLIAICVGAGVLFGLAPALRLSRLDVSAALADGGHGATSGRRGRRLSALLVAGEMALAVALLAGTGVMLRSFFNVADANIGVDTTNILSAYISLPHDKYPDAKAQITFYDSLQRRLGAIPGIASVALADVNPVEDTFHGHPAYALAGAPARGAPHRRTVAEVVVGPRYFQTLRAKVVSGRGFSRLDRASSLPVAIVNRRFATQNWPGQDALGKHLRLFRDRQPDAWLTVVGVVSNIMQNDHLDTRRGFDPLVYLPYRQSPVAYMSVLARTRVPPESLAKALRQQVHEIDPQLPVLSLMPLNRWLSTLRGPYRFRRQMAILFLVFAGIAVLLASVGLYAIIALSVGQRTQEIGVRTAIGATAGDIRKLVFRQGVVPMAVGLVTGLIAAVAVDRLLESELVRVSPADPLVLVGASAVLVSAAALGCVIPARRASRVDPVVALRHE